MDGSILGRDAELLALEEASQRDRLLAVVGPPGVGKSKLVEAWTERAEARGLSTVLCHVDAATTLAELESKVAQALEVPLPGSAARLAPLLAGNGKTLLILDGVDRLPLAELETTLRAWTTAAPELRIVTTGRVAWAADQTLTLRPLRFEHAAALFVERARAAGYRSRNTADERQAIDALVARLDGLPLAVLLAGARASVLSPQQIGQRLERELPGGEGGPLRAALELSWSMLTPLERRVLVVASYFRGAFHVLLLEAMIDTSEDDVLVAFESLVSKSLVQRTDEGHAAVWFRLLETVRRFASEHADAESLPRAVFAARLTQKATALAVQLDTHDEGLALEEIAGLADDLAYVTEHEDARLVAEAGVALAAWGVPRGLVALDVLERSARAAEGAEPAVRGLARYWLARGQARAGAVVEAEQEVERALDDAELEAPLRAKLEILRAHLWLERGDLERAHAALVPVPARLERANAHFLEGELANVRGRIAEARGDLDAAAEAFVGARGLYRRVGALRQAGRALQNLAIVRDAQGRYDEALARFEEALREHVETGDPAGVADNLLNTGSLHLNAGALELAEELGRRALDEERRLGNRRFEGLALANLGLIAHLRGDLAAAKVEYHRAQAIFQEARDRRFEHVLDMFLGAAHAETGAHAEAMRSFAAAERAFEDSGDAGNLLVLRTLEALLAPQDATARLEAARAALASGAVRASELSLAERIVTRAGARSVPRNPSSTTTLDIGPEARWFARAGQERVDLSARASLRGILAALVHAGSEPLPQEALFRAGWPGERVLALAARDRVYTAVRTLRKMGLEGVLARRDEGYFLDAVVQRRAA